MKVALVGQPWNRVRPDAGSVAIWNYEVGRRLAKGWDVSIYGNQFPGEAECEVVGGIRLRRISGPFDIWIKRTIGSVIDSIRPTRPFTTTRAFYRQFYSRVARDLSEWDADIVHVQMYPQALATIANQHRARVNIAHLHVEWQNQIDTRWFIQNTRDYDAVVSCSDYLTKCHLAKCQEIADRVRTLGNGVDPELFRSIEATARNMEQTPPVILYVGRISPEKGIHSLLEALPRIVARHPRVELRIIGPKWLSGTALGGDLAARITGQDPDSELGALFSRTTKDALFDWLRQNAPNRFRHLPYSPDYLESLERKLGPEIWSHVRVLGLVPYHNLPNHYQSADVVVLPSLAETFGMPLIEAMACSVPTVSTNVGGIPEQVVDGVTGVLVPPADSEGLSVAISDLLDDPERRQRMGRAGRRRATEIYSWDRITSEADALYRELLGRLPPRAARGRAP